MNVHCAACYLNILCTDNDSFKCDVCDDVFHGSCLDYNPASLDIIHEVMKEYYKWICNGCRDSAKLVRSGKKPVGGRGFSP